MTAPQPTELRGEQLKRRTIAIVGGFAPSLVNFRGALIAKLIRDGHRVIAIAPDIDKSVEAALQRLGAEPKGIELSRASVNPATELRSFIALRRVFAATRPDIVVPYTVKPVIWGTLAARSLGIRHVVPIITGLGYAFAVQSGRRRHISYLAASFLYRAALRHASQVLFQNPDDVAFFRSRRLLRPNIPTAVVNGSGVDIRHFAPVSVPASPSFLMIARLLGDKGVREYAAAAKIIRDRHQVHVRLVGYIDQSPDSITQRELDEMIASGVEFLGRMDDVRPAIADCSVYVLPSYGEGTPRSVLEAMAMGRPVITTNAPGCRETVVEGRNGYLVPPRDVGALVAAMERFVGNATLAAEMASESRRIAEEKYDVERVNADIVRHLGL